jgi:hypothetical protein
MKVTSDCRSGGVVVVATDGAGLRENQTGLASTFSRVSDGCDQSKGIGAERTSIISRLAARRTRAYIETNSRSSPPNCSYIAEQAITSVFHLGEAS